MIKMENCQDESPILSLKDLAQIALGHGGAMKQSNIAVLHSLIHGILKKLNCENEVVTISGVNSEKLKALLSKAHPPLLPCGQDLNVLTEKLNSLPALEKKIKNMEMMLDKHLSVNTFEKKGAFKQKQFKDIEENWQTTNFRKNRISPPCKTKTKESVEERESEGNFEHPMLQKSRRFILHSSETPSLASFEKEAKNFTLKKSKLFTLDSSDIFSCAASHRSTLSQSRSVFYSNWKQRIEDIEAKKVIKLGPITTGPGINLNASDVFVKQQEKKELQFKKKEDEEEMEDNEEYTIQTDLSGDNDIPDISACYHPCEGFFTIPSPENDLPRALLKSSQLALKIKEYSLYPFERRVFILRKKMDALEESMQACIDFWSNLMKRYPDLEFVFRGIAELHAKISNKQIIRADTIYGMEEIFDQKAEKSILPQIKKEFDKQFKRMEDSIAQVKHERKRTRVSAFALSPTPKNTGITFEEEETSTDESNSCECQPESNSVKEPRLVDRIQRLSSKDLGALRERLTHGSTKQIRITSNHIAVNLSSEGESNTVFSTASEDKNYDT